MTVGEALRAAEKELTEAGVPSPRSDAETLTAAVLNVRRSDLLLRSNEILQRRAVEKLKGWVSRRAGREPVQFILGYAPFLDLEITVEPGVFVPRPETEGLAELCIGLVQGVSNPVLVEVCAGTAALSLWFAKKRSDVNVIAVERNHAAVLCAKKTASRYRLDINLIQGDLFEPFSDGPLTGTADIIVANPPYIPSSDIKALPPEVLDWEPMDALDGGPNGLSFYRPLVQGAFTLLRFGGWVAFEVGDGAAEAVAEIIELTGGFNDPKTKPDLAGIKRYIYAQRSHS
jgi:release factor glutamine methyltransferase